MESFQIQVLVRSAGIYPRGRKWPTMALEAGYSESYDALIDDMDLLLQGTQRRIGLVIVVKIEPLHPARRRYRMALYRSMSMTKS
ncbi:hypothetical protein V1527DRAFT_479033 [Lipomyces starkeyi]